MSAVFDIKEHVIEGQHIREYPRATAHAQEEILQLAVKQYIPKDNPKPKPGDITIIASHANGFVKELYEPLWEDLLHTCRQSGVNIRGIWIADVAWQGQSGILNEHKLGNDPSWFDHARDLLHLTNVFRAQMPRPVIGVGHSFGANIIINVAYMHPRLFSGLVMIDPVMSSRIRFGPLYGFSTMRASASRRDLWSSRQEAEQAVRRNKFYATWDPRAVDNLIKFGYRDGPTLLYPDKTGGEVTLTTTKHLECFTYYRPILQGPRDPHTGKRTMDRSLIPDATSEVDEFPNFPFYGNASSTTAARLGELRPSVLWIAGELSAVCPPETQQEKMELTGYGPGGNGGAKAGRVKEYVVKGVGHLVAMERPKKIAEQAAGFIRDEVDRWRREEESYRKDHHGQFTLKKQ
ncbi:alpha/beta-hydrolase [Cryphonectria parasitica EP155]|uniref:Alpha/beta-hydrolase n=1 Tax=Cryphonectria parasitica (strain ATCC 38755 / EP155) TaxID=660469 RepID=A0A9P4XUV5_CRYP1|nr:alpha/beta-hydrolase [Cryphonectria parasitica EP155]KAF3761333.1 alpha/beta-hydrolase [Cryphonectria parasitica EP155]